MHHKIFIKNKNIIYKYNEDVPVHYDGNSNASYRGYSRKRNSIMDD